MTTAREIMETTLITVTEQTSLAEAITLLMAHRISGLPVVDADLHVDQRLLLRPVDIHAPILFGDTSHCQKQTCHCAFAMGSL